MHKMKIKRQYVDADITKRTPVDIKDIVTLRKFLQEMDVIENMNLNAFTRLENKVAELIGRSQNINLLFDEMAAQDKKNNITKI